MAAFRADTEQLKHLLDTWGNDLFALCYLETGGTRRAMALMTDVLCDMAAGEKLCGWPFSTAPTTPCGGLSA